MNTTWPTRIPYSRPTPAPIAVDGTAIANLGHSNHVHACEALLQKHSGGAQVLMTPSCTAALEMTSLALALGPEDEVILPSFTFVTTASAFALRGAKLKFVDIDPVTLNIDIEAACNAITPATKAIVVVHYAGVACDLSRLQAALTGSGIIIIEDAAQGIGASYHGQPLGSIGHFGGLSFHHTKNIHAGGEGGALMVRDENWANAMEIVQEKGTDRSRFLRGEVDKYTWQKLSSSYVMADIQGMILLPQLRNISTLTNRRLSLWNTYRNNLQPLTTLGIRLPEIPPECAHNGHIFHLRLPTGDLRDRALAELRRHNIEATSHYVPLHSTPAGLRYGVFCGNDRHTTDSASRLIRLPIFDELTIDEQNYICEMTTRICGQLLAGRSGTTKLEPRDPPMADSQARL